MTFISINFILFISFILITEPFIRCKKHLYIAILSLLFYSFYGFDLVLLLLISSVLDHLAAKRFQTKNRYYWLIFSISLNLIFLTGVKIHYFQDLNFSAFNDLKPIGISFYTLQSISYLLDVYNKKVNRVESFSGYLAYICFFPQLIAGPIERFSKLYPQLANFGLTDTTRGLQALRLFVIGFYLKLVVSNRLAGPINIVAESFEYDFIFFINGVFAMIYIYADFFSYTLMARGIALLFGINLNINFNRPFCKKNLVSFWQNWHISLTKWMTDYFYIPIMLKLNSSKTTRLLFSVIAMILIGLWHGIGWNYVVFGVIHGIAMQLFPLIDQFTNSKLAKFPKVNNCFGVILILAITGNIFLSGTNQQLISYFQCENYSFFSNSNFTAYFSLSFIIGLLGFIPLIIHEFSKESYLYKKMTLMKEIKIILSFLILTALFYNKGGSHIYYAF